MPTYIHAFFLETQFSKHQDIHRIHIQHAAVVIHRDAINLMVRQNRTRTLVTPQL